ncbi:MAG: 4Fe-4S binding protein [Candidatus Syntropharchaeia archaeon]
MKMRDELGEIVEREDVKYLIGYQKGSHGFRVTPIFAEKKEDVKKLIFSPLCVNNLVSYLVLEDKPPLPRGEEADRRKVAVLVKGCDSRAIVQLMVENGIEREDVIVIGIPCSGVVDTEKLDEIFPDVLEGDVIDEGDHFRVIYDGKEEKVPKEELLAEKCKSCEYPNPLVYDILIGEKVEKKKADYTRIEELEGKSSDERWKYWKEKFERCIRCYACRNICPLCYCDDCILEKLNPQWIRRSVSLPENIAFQITRVLHLAGRCIGCGECERACPMNIPLSELNRKMEKDVKEIFDYVSGVNPDEPPLLASFKVDDPEEFIL